MIIFKLPPMPVARLHDRQLQAVQPQLLALHPLHASEMGAKSFCCMQRRAASTASTRAHNASAGLGTAGSAANANFTATAALLVGDALQVSPSQVQLQSLQLEPGSRRRLLVS